MPCYPLALMHTFSFIVLYELVNPKRFCLVSEPRSERLSYLPRSLTASSNFFSSIAFCTSWVWKGRGSVKCMTKTGAKHVFSINKNKWWQIEWMQVETKIGIIQMFSISSLPSIKKCNETQGWRSATIKSSESDTNAPRTAHRPHATGCAITVECTAIIGAIKARLYCSTSNRVARPINHLPSVHIPSEASAPIGCRTETPRRLAYWLWSPAGREQPPRPFGWPAWTDNKRWRCRINTSRRPKVYHCDYYGKLDDNVRKKRRKAKIQIRVWGFFSVKVFLFLNLAYTVNLFVCLTCNLRRLLLRRTWIKSIMPRWEPFSDSPMRSSEKSRTWSWFCERQRARISGWA